MNKFLSVTQLENGSDLADYLNKETPVPQIITGYLSTNIINAGLNAIMSSHTPIDNSDLVNKKYVDENTLTNPLTGGDLTITAGNLIVSNGDVETTDYFSLNTEIQKIDNLTVSTQGPNITNISGKVIQDDLAVTNIYDKSSETTFINLDGTDMNVTAVDIKLNGNIMASQDYSDLKVLKTGDTITGSLTIDTNLNVLGDYQKNNVIGNLPLELNASTNLICGGAQSINTVNTTVYGQESLESSLSGGSNSFFGFKSGKGYLGSSSVGIGNESLLAPLSTGGIFNIAIGTNALQNQVSSSLCTAIGFGALAFCTTGISHTCIGGGSGGGLGIDITTEFNCTLIGANTKSAGFSDTIVLSSGSATKSNQCTINNVNEIVAESDGICDIGSSTRQMKDIHISGTYKKNGLNIVPTVEKGDGSNVTSINSLNSITTGYNNLVYGNLNANNLTEGQGNVIFGSVCLINAITSSGNTCMGVNTMEEYIGSNSIGIGGNACKRGNGDEHICIGINSAPNMTGGARSISIGNDSLLNATTPVNCVVIGHSAGANSSNEVNTVLIGYNTSTANYSDTVVLGTNGISSKANQCTINNVTEIVAGSDNTCDLGSSTRGMKDIYLGGSINTLTPAGGKYSQWDEIIVNGSSTIETSFISGSNNTGTAIFQPTEFIPGASYHIKIAGSFDSVNKESARYRIKLGGTTILDSGQFQYANLGVATYAYEIEIDMQIRVSGASGIIYTNAQFASNKNSNDNGFRGNNSQQIQPINLLSPLALDITWQWNDNSNDKIITNRMIVVTRTY